MRMPPLLADFILPGACKPICEKSLTLPLIDLKMGKITHQDVGQIDMYVRTGENIALLRRHCNGDAVGEQYLTAYEKALRETGTAHDLRPGMIHCQTVRNAQFDRMVKLNMIASIFVRHVFYWGGVHLRSFGEKSGNHISLRKGCVGQGYSN